ncbi:MAG: WecB/TagA/CpsF family glycosyltransferase [Pseudomonadales bacterium]
MEAQKMSSEADMAAAANDGQVVPSSAAEGSNDVTSWRAKDQACVLGVDIDGMTMADVLSKVALAIRSRRRLRIGVVNAAKLVNMDLDEALRLDVSSSDLILADGMSVVWASKLGPYTLPERVAGIDLMHDIMRNGAAHGHRVFLLGAKQAVCDEVAKRASADYPGIVIAGQRNGYFDDPDEAAIVAEINAAQPDVLFVAMTSPKKERFMARWEDTLTVPVIHGVGGSFDVYAGVVSRAPEWMQRTGLEWLHRVLQEPGRMWRRYLTTNSLFVIKVLREAVSRRLKS